MNDNTNSWRDDALQDSENVGDLSVICVKKEMNGNSGTCQDIDECEYFNCGQGVCQNNIGSHRCICNQGSINFLNDQNAICGK